MAERIAWSSVIDEAAEIVQSYSTGVTLRQLFYRLVSRQLIPNKQSAYSRLSSLTAQARREGWFPDLIDNTRQIRRPAHWDGPDDAMDAIISQFRRDRTEGQDYSLYVAVEKNALATLISSWYRDKGIPVLAFGGYPSQTFVTDIINDIESQNRPAILIYGGDFDATGVDILRDFIKRTEGSWEETKRIALNEDQIKTYKLPPLPGKSWDPRAANFIAQYGKLLQVELDALPPDVLKNIYDEAVDEYWDYEAQKKCMRREEKERKQFIKPHEIKRMIDALDDLSQSIDDEALSNTMAFEEAADIIAKYEGIF